MGLAVLPFRDVRIPFPPSKSSLEPRSRLVKGNKFPKRPETSVLVFTPCFFKKAPNCNRIYVFSPVGISFRMLQNSRRFGPVAATRYRERQYTVLEQGFPP